MAENEVFAELSSSLSDKERKELLKKISASLSTRQTEEKQFFRAELKQDERDHLARNELQHRGLFFQIRVWFQKLISGQSLEKSIITIRMREIKANINKKSPGITGFESNDITPVFAQRIYDFYGETIRLIPVFHALWLESELLEQFLTDSLEKRISEPKRKLEQLVPIAELEEVFGLSGRKEDIKRAISSKIEEYTTSIPDSVFHEIENGVLPLYYLKDIVLFPYQSFFQLFNCDVLEYKGKEYPSFKSANALLLVDYFERMYYSLYSSSKTPGSSEYCDLALSLFTSRAAASSDPEQDLSLEDPDHSANPNHGAFQELKSNFVRLQNQVKRLLEEIPWIDIIKYFRNDPYVKMQIYLPKIKLKDFYQSSLKLKFFAQIDDTFKKVRENVIVKEIQSLFKGSTLIPFSFYFEDPRYNFKSIGLPNFAHVRSLNLLYNFIVWYFKKYIREFIQVLGHVVLVQNRIAQNRLFQGSASLEDLEIKITQYDLGMSPDSEDGKKYRKNLPNIETDMTGQKLHRGIVAQKDREARELLDKGIESVQNLQKVFEELVLTGQEHVIQQLHVPHTSPFDEKTVPLRDIVARIGDHTKRFLKVMELILQVEKGS